MITSIKVIDQRFNNLSDYLLYNKHELTCLNYATKANNDFNPKEFNLVPLDDWDFVERHRDYFISFVENIKNNYNVECTLMVYYPKGSYIGWHTNSNFEFYNAICTFSDTGNSFFEYVNNKGVVVKVDDMVGWSVKKTKWGKEENISHRAVSNCNKITITFSSKEESVIDNFISIIS